MTDRTPAIIACMRDMVAERCDKSDDANLLVAHAALTIAVDSELVFGLWPVTGTDEMHAAGLLKIIDGETSWPTTADEDRPIAGAVARRMAEVACSLFVQGVDEQAAAWLYTAAGRLIGTGTPEATSVPKSAQNAEEAATLSAKANRLDMINTRLRTLSKPTRDFVSVALGIWPEDKQ